MNTVEAVFDNGVFKPLGPVAIRDHQRVRLSIETIEPLDLASWLSAVRDFHRHLIADHGVLPDSTAEISADRHCHE